MLILFLDDMKVRQESFEKQCYAHDDLWQVWDSAQALDRLKDRRYDVIFLDHDLADDHYSIEEIRATPLAHRHFPNCGCVVATAIAALDPAMQPSAVIVHSHNNVAGTRMLRILYDAGIECAYSPFGPNLRQVVSFKAA